MTGLIARPLTEIVKRGRAREFLISRSIRQCAALRDSDGTFNLIAAAIGDTDWVFPISLRRHGDQLSKEELRAMGLRANTKLSRQFIDCLSEKGAADPVDAASQFSRIFNTAWTAANDLARYVSMFGADARVAFHASNMQAGPCGEAVSMAAVMPTVSAPLLPLDGCSHPAQCACGYYFPTR